jgi:plasmid stabilization system protein ParE
MKSYGLVMESQAEEDILVAYDYYNGIYGNLSGKFVNALEATLAQIVQNPYYQIKFQNIRCLKVKKFPYTIHYIIDEKYDEVHVLAVVHTATNPDKIWMWREEE